MKEILDAIRPHEIYSALHIGCGVGGELAEIKNEFPNIKIAGCDADKDKIETAKKEFAKREWGKGWDKQPPHSNKDYIGRTADTILYRGPKLENIDFKVGDPMNLPFHGASFDLVFTTGVLETIGPDNIIRVMREIRRVNSRNGKVLFVEGHSKSILKRVIAGLRGRHIYNYEQMLNDIFFKNVRIRGGIITATI